MRAGARRVSSSDPSSSFHTAGGISGGRPKLRKRTSFFSPRRARSTAAWRTAGPRDDPSSPTRMVPIAGLLELGRSAPGKEAIVFVDHRLPDQARHDGAAEENRPEGSEAADACGVLEDDDAEAPEKEDAVEPS